MESGIQVVLLEKAQGGELRVIEERMWGRHLVQALEHANYLIVNGREYETVEGRLNLDLERLELLLVPLTHSPQV